MRDVLTLTFAIALVWAIPASLAARRAVRLMR